METGQNKRKPRRGEPWAIGSVLGYSSGEILDKLAVMKNVDPIVGPFLRGVPSLILGIVLVWKNHTLGQLRRGTPRYIGNRAIFSMILAGTLSTLGLFGYYYAIQLGGL